MKSVRDIENGKFIEIYQIGIKCYKYTMYKDFLNLKNYYAEKLVTCVSLNLQVALKEIFIGNI